MEGGVAMPMRIGLVRRAMVIPALCIVLSLASAGCGKTESVGSQSSVQRNAETKVIEPLPEYDVVDTKDLSFSNCVRKQVTVRTAYRLSEVEVTKVAQSVVSRVTCEHKVNAVSILMYDTPHTTGPYTLASVDWAPGGDWAQARTVNTGDYSRHGFTVHMAQERLPGPERVGGLPLAKAKQCFLDICRAQDRAFADAQAKYPTPKDLMKQSELARALSERYEKTVREEYRITEEQQGEIVAFGVIQLWPMD